MAWASLPVFAFFSSFKTSRLMMLASIYQLLYNLFYVCQFSCAALAVKHRFGILNDYLENSVITTSIWDKNVVSKKALDLRFFAESYNKLCDILQIINATFTLHLVITLLNFMAIEIFGGYGVIRELTLPSRNFMNLIASLAWILSHFPIKIFMAYSGKSTTEEAERSLVLVSKIIINTEDHHKEQKNALNIILHLLQVREKKLSNVFFSIDFNIILVVRKFRLMKTDFTRILFKMLSTVVTYLVITCQVELSL